MNIEQAARQLEREKAMIRETVSDTPRTDIQAETGRDGVFHAEVDYVVASFARDLERESDRLRVRLKLAHDYLKAEWRRNALSGPMGDNLIESLNEPV